MAKLYDKDDPNQIKEDQSPYGDEVESSDDPSPAAIHGRVVRLETNAKHNATNEGVARVEVKVARVEGKVDEAKAELKGEIKSGNAKLDGKIDTAKAENKAGIAELKGEIKELKSENAWLKNMQYTIIVLLVAVLAKDNQTVADIINSITNFFR